MTASCVSRSGRGQSVSLSKVKAILRSVARGTIRYVLLVIAGTTLLLLAACAAHHAAELKPAGDPDWWLGTLDDAQKHYTDAIDKNCPPQGLLSNTKCLKTRIVETFAKQNPGSTHCDTSDTWGSVLLCADLFTATTRM